MIVAPAMNDRMYAHSATQDNLTLLHARGVHVIGPNTGELASQLGEYGTGRMSEPEEPVAACEGMLGAAAAALGGLRVLVTAGGTREPIDPSGSSATVRRDGWDFRWPRRPPTGRRCHGIAANVSLPAPAESARSPCRPRASCWLPARRGPTPPTFC